MASDSSAIVETLKRVLSEADTDDALRRRLDEALERALEESSGATIPDPQFSSARWLEGTAPLTPPSAPESPRLGRYELLGRLGGGGMGEVFKVRDPVLGRAMAMKVIHAHLRISADDLDRFLEEAQITAQLRHPSVVSVHELGELPDGRFYFTMEQIRGDELAHVIDEVQRASRGGPWRASPGGWTLRRMLDAFRRICEGVAYAHSRGVIHRDLKPSNIMVGEFGEVHILDWGLARLQHDLRSGAAEDRFADPGDDPIQLNRDLTSGARGRVAGTPAYMSPEQARGEQERIGPATDIYALGAVLYRVLSGRAPYSGGDGLAILRQVAEGPPPPPARKNAANELMDPDPFIPAELARICQRAMAREPEDRYPDAMAIAQDVSNWLEGLHRRDQAMALVLHAEGLLPEVQALERAAKRKRAEAAALLDQVQLHEPVDRKLPAWRLEEEAEREEQAARARRVEVVSILQAALSHAPDLPEAHAALAALYRERHASAERRRDAAAAAQWEILIAAHDHGENARYLRGDGALSLCTDPPGAEVTLYRYGVRDRRLAAERIGPIGRTPIREHRLPRGSYLVELNAPGHAPVRYPVLIERASLWDGVPPGQSEPQPIRLPPADALGPHDVYVPAGWFQCGGDPNAAGSLAAGRVWLDSFVVRRHPVTHREYLAFLNALVESGREDEARRHAPAFESFSFYERDERGLFVLRRQGKLLYVVPDMPALSVDWNNAMAFARWTAARERQPWTLPSDLEWEKAARGVDGRKLPWGDFLDPTWCNMRDSRPDQPSPAPVQDFPVDESPYGVRGLAGNVMDWCRDAYRNSGPPIVEGRVSPAWLAREPEAEEPRVVRGGHFYGVGQIAFAAHRYYLQPTFTGYLMGFRLARPAP